MRHLAYLLLLSVGLVQADDTTDRLQQQLATILPGLQMDSIAPSPLPGVYQVLYGSQVLYISADGKIALQGRMIDVATRRDLTEPVLNTSRKAIVDGIPESEMIVFEPAGGKARFTLTTFTDIDCPYCRKMHAEIKQLTDSGVRVRYMLYPRAGVDSPSYSKAVSVWCAENQQEALTLSKAGKEIEDKQCANPVDRHMELARALGLRGTPMSLMEDGGVIGGYLQPEAMIARLSGEAR